MVGDMRSDLPAVSGAVPAGVHVMPERHLDLERPVHSAFGLVLDAVDMDQAVERVRSAAFAHRRCFISTPNLNFLISARRDADFRASVLHSDLSLADGMPVVWLARQLGAPIPERVAGSDLFERLQVHPGPALKVFFFGGQEGAAQAACAHVNERGGGMHCVGFVQPGFGTVEEMSDDATLARINESGAHFLVVSLGAKKGQAWIMRNKDRLVPPVLCHLGAVINFTAGSVRRAPRWMQVGGLEWLWRIREEPALFSRYWTDGLAFLRLLRRESLTIVSRRRRSTRIRGVARSARIERVAGPAATLRLAGDWTVDDLPALREAVREHMVAPEQASPCVTLDVSGVTSADSAFEGLLQVLFTANILRITGMPDTLKRQFSWTRRPADSQSDDL